MLVRIYVTGSVNGGLVELQVASREHGDVEGKYVLRSVH